MSTDLIPTSGHHAVTQFTPAERELMRESFAPGTTDAQFELFLWTARARGLDPRAGQIHAVVRKTRLKEGDKWVEKPVMTIQTGIDGYRLIAQRTGEYEGKAGPFWCGPDGVWKDVWLEDEPPAAAKVGVMRRGDNDYSWHVARWKEYVQTVDEYDGDRKTGKKKPNTMWQKMDANQLAKCAEAGALRARFPEDLAGIFVDAEYNATYTIDQADAERQLSEPRKVQKPQSRSGQGPSRPSAPPIRQPHEKPFGTEDDAEPVDAEFTERPVAEAMGEADEDSEFSAFWIELQEALDGTAWEMGDVGMVLNTPPTSIGIRGWWKANRERGNLIAFIKRKLETVSAG